MTTELSKKEYLKRYLEKDKDSERKHKRKRKTVKAKTNVSRLKIVDQDINLKSINFGDKDDEDDPDEAPVVAEVIDDRPVEEKLKELYESSRWKKLDSDGSSQSHFAATSKNDNLQFSKTRHDSESDTSPSRIEKQRRNSRRLDSDSNISPLREISNKSSRYDSDSDTSSSQTERQSRNKRRHDSDSNFSPHRGISNRHDSDTEVLHQHQKDTSRSRKNDSDSDISPPRHNVLNKSSKHNSDSDISPPRHDVFNKSTKHNSPPRHNTLKKSVSQVKNKVRRHGSDSDISPPRHETVNKSKNSKRYDSDSDEVQYKKSSPSKLKSSRDRNENSDSDISPPRSSSTHNPHEGKKLNKTLSGLKAGLQNSKALQKEVSEMRKREKNHISMLDDEVSGRNASTIVRDRKTGMKRDLNKEQEAKAEENERARKYEEKYNKWGKGIEQTEDKMKKMMDEAYESSKPLARYKDDEDLDERLKSIIHEDDPMAEYIKKKKQKNVPSMC